MLGLSCGLHRDAASPRGACTPVGICPGGCHIWDIFTHLPTTYITAEEVEAERRRADAMLDGAQKDEAADR